MKHMALRYEISFNSNASWVWDMDTLIHGRWFYEHSIMVLFWPSNDAGIVKMCVIPKS